MVKEKGNSPVRGSERDLLETFCGEPSGDVSDRTYRSALIGRPQAG